MKRALILRLFHSVVALYVLVTAVFFLSRLVADPVDLLIPADATYTEELRDRLERKYSLDKPVIVQYGTYMFNLLKGDLGQSLYFGQAQVTDIIGKGFRNTLPLALLASAIAIGLSLPLGTISALRRGTWIDSVAQTVAAFGLAVPGFWLGIVLIYLFAVTFEIFPAGGKAGITSFILPAIVIPTFVIGGMTRLLRSSMLEVLNSQYVMVARSKGLMPRTVIMRHALRNSLIPVVTYGTVAFAAVLNGSLVVETVFSWPGLGSVTLQAINTSDYPLIQGVVLTVGVIVVTANFFVDVAYLFLDPRIRDI